MTSNPEKTHATPASQSAEGGSRRSSRRGAAARQARVRERRKRHWRINRRQVSLHPGRGRRVRANIEVSFDSGLGCDAHRHTPHECGAHHEGVWRRPLVEGVCPQTSGLPRVRSHHLGLVYLPHGHVVAELRAKLAAPPRKTRPRRRENRA